MCVGVPMQIQSTDGVQARCVAKGVEREVNLMMLTEEQLGPGDHVLVHLGFAVQKLAPDAAAEHWELLDQLMRPLQPGDDSESQRSPTSGAVSPGAHASPLREEGASSRKSSEGSDA